MAGSHKTLAVSLALAAALSACGPEEKVEVQIEQVPKQGEVLATETFDLCSYTAKRGDFPIRIADRIMREEAGSSAYRAGWGFVIEHDHPYDVKFISLNSGETSSSTGTLHTALSPTELVMDSNPQLRGASHFPLKPGQKVRLPDLNHDGRIGNMPCDLVGKLDATYVQPRRLTAGEAASEARYWGASHRPHVDYVLTVRK